VGTVDGVVEGVGGRGLARGWIGRMEVVGRGFTEEREEMLTGEKGERGPGW
jgi:hypothetical protein